MKNSNPNPSVSYGFSEALNLVEDYRNALFELLTDPTNTQVIIETEEGETYTGGNGYFMIRKSGFLNPTDETATETPYIFISADGLDDPNGYCQAYNSIDDLRESVTEIVDNYQVTSIYIDSL